MMDPVTQLWVINDHVIDYHPGACSPDSNRPTILLINGAALVSGGWQEIRRRLPDEAILAVDRPGYHGTTRTHLPSLPEDARTLTRLADRWRSQGGSRLLVVAHSMGAFHAEALARLRPDAVCGIVLVDPSLLGSLLLSPHMFDALWPVMRNAMYKESALALAQRVFRWGMRVQTHHPHLIREQDWARAWNSRDAMVAGTGELLSYWHQAADLTLLRRHHDRLVAAPVVVLQAPPYATAAQERVLEESCRNLLWQRVPHSRHLMMLDAPDIVCQAITDLLGHVSAADSTGMMN